MKFIFGDIVIVNENMVGVIVKSWENKTYEVYVRSFNNVRSYTEGGITRLTYSKELSDEDMEWQNN